MTVKLQLLFFVFCGVLVFVRGNDKPVAVVPILKCSNHDYTLVDNKCIKKDIVQPTTKCPKHGRLYEGKCVVHEPVSGTMKCPQGYEMVKKKCVSNSVLPLVYECPSYNYTPVRQVDGKGPGECIRESQTKSQSSCPDGYKMSYDGVCFKQTYDKASVLCPKGYTPDKKGCAISELVSPLFSCPKQYTLQGNANCVKDKTDERKCPSGWSLITNGDKNECEKIVLRDAKPVCSFGVIDEKKHMCLTTEKEKPNYTCKHKNATYMNGKCIRVIEEDAIRECSHGYKFDGTHCVKKTNTPAEYSCSETETLVKNKCQSIEKSVVGACVGFECMREKIKPADIKCPEGAKMVEKGCELIIRVDSNKICENNGELRHNKCVYYSQKEPVVTCKDGDLTEDGKCVVREIVPMTAKCDKGYKVSEDGEGCVKSEQTYPIMTCPSGSAVKGGKCIIEALIDAIVECPHGYTYDVKGCIKFHKHDPVLVCPKDMKLVNQSCVPKHQEKHKKEPCLIEQLHTENGPVFEHSGHSETPVGILPNVQPTTTKPWAGTKGGSDIYEPEHSRTTASYPRKEFEPEHSRTTASYPRKESAYIARNEGHLQ